MDNLKKLEVNRLLNEFEFMKADYEYKSELIQIADKDFIESVNRIVENHSELKKIYHKKFDSEYQKKIQVISESDQVIKELEKFEDDLKDPKLKSIYRNIVKKTHPDKVDQPKLNLLYIESTKYYEDNDLLSLYKICDQLNVDYEFEESDFILIKSKIEDVKNKIKFIENTFTWKWLNSDDSSKNDLILSFIKLQIG